MMPTAACKQTIANVKLKESKQTRLMEHKVQNRQSYLSCQLHVVMRQLNIYVCKKVLYKLMILTIFKLTEVSCGSYTLMFGMGLT